MLGLVHSASLLGVHGHAVTVEVHTTGGGLPSFTVVGSPDSACREARDRVRAAIESSSLKWPMERVTRSEEHTSELQSLMRISYAVFCLKKKITSNKPSTII